MFSLTVLFVLAVIPAIKGQKKKTCEVLITPGQHVESGSDVQIMCRSSCIEGPVFWTLNDVPMDPNLSRSINASYSVLSLKNFTDQRATLQCVSAFTNLVLGGAFISTYTKPSKVSCLLKHHTRVQDLPNLVCTWEHTTSPSLRTIIYIVKKECNDCLIHETEYCTSETTSCLFNNTPAFLRNLSIIVRANTSKWAVDSDKYSFDPLHIWVIGPPGIEVTALSSHLLITLERPWGLDHMMVNCQVKHKQTFDNGTQEKVLDVSLPHKKSRLNVTIEDVTSCAAYSVSARCALRRAPWSDWTQERTVLSKLNTRTFKFRLWRKVATQERKGVREVKVLWTAIPPTCEERFTCNIEWNLYKKYTKSLDSSHKATVCSPSSCTIAVGREAYKVRLTVFRDGSRVANESVYVPAIGETLPRVSPMQVSTRDGAILLSWRAPLQNVRGYVVDWSHDGNTYFWKTTQRTTTELHDLEDFQPYNITVTPVFEDKTGLGREALQVCSRERVPQKVTTEVQAKDTSAIVRWDIEAQDKCSAAVEYFGVFFQTEEGVQHGSSLQYITFNATKRQAVVENLTRDTKYKIYVMAIGHSGNVSSIERYFETHKYDTGLFVVLSISGAFGFLLLTFLGGCCIFWYDRCVGKMVPNPGLSSLVLWSSQSHQKIGSQFSDPLANETVCARVFLPELDDNTNGVLHHGDDPSTVLTNQRKRLDPAVDSSTPSSGKDGQAVEKVVADVAAAQTNPPTEASPEETPCPEYVLVLPLLEASPYRSQSAAALPAPRSSKNRGHLPVTKHLKSSTMYVSLDMFQDGPDR